MSAQELERMVKAMPPQKFRDWYRRQLLIANGLRASLNRRFGRQGIQTTSPIELPEAIEIVSETCLRIFDQHDDRYVWDPSTSFDSFFARCLRSTCSSLRDAERRHTDGRSIVARQGFPQNISAEQDDHVARRQYATALAAAIATTSMTGAAVDYASKLDVYAFEKWGVPEIANDIDVKESSVASLRRRLLNNDNFRRALKNPKSK
jgi:DNA-directed RNA polymerase specialized sigma24 family protein